MKKIGFKTNNGFVFENKGSIMYCKANINYTKLFFNGGRKIVVVKSIKEVEEILSDRNFCRIHKSIIINVSEVTKFNHKESLIIMSDGSEHKIARRRKMIFMENFDIV